MENLDNSWSSITNNQSEPQQPDFQYANQPNPTIEILDHEVNQIREHETKIELTGDQLMKKIRQKQLIIIAAILIIILIPIIIFLSKPKQVLLYSKYEEFGPCISQKSQCFQETIVYLSGKVAYSGKITKTANISRSKVKDIKKQIIDSKLISTDCKEAQILMEYKLTHVLAVNGQKNEIKSPGCESEIDVLDSNIENILK